MAKYNYNKVKKDFIDKMRPFVEGIKKYYSDNDINGTIFFRECTLNGDDYIGEYSDTDNLNELFDVIWKEYFLNGKANFNTDSEFTFDCYFDNGEQSDYTGCYFIYEKDSLDKFWCDEFDQYLDGSGLNTIKVEWDTDGQSLEDCGLSEVVSIPTNIDEENVADWLSDEYGYCVNSWCYAN